MSSTEHHITVYKGEEQIGEFKNTGIEEITLQRSPIEPTPHILDYPSSIETAAYIETEQYNRIGQELKTLHRESRDKPTI